jgi:hypothetical protein
MTLRNMIPLAPGLMGLILALPNMFGIMDMKKQGDPVSWNGGQ